MAQRQPSFLSSQSSIDRAKKMLNGILDSKKAYLDSLDVLLQLPVMFAAADIPVAKYNGLFDMVDAIVKQEWIVVSQVRERLNLYEEKVESFLGIEDLLEKLCDSLFPTYEAYSNTLIHKASVYCKIESSEVKLRKINLEVMGHKKSQGCNIPTLINLPLCHLRDQLSLYKKFFDSLPPSHIDYNSLKEIVDRFVSFVSVELDSAIQYGTSFQKLGYLMMHFSAKDVEILEISNPSTRVLKQDTIIKMSSKAQEKTRELILLDNQIIVAKLYIGTIFNGNTASMDLKSAMPLLLLKLIDIPNPVVLSTPITLLESESVSGPSGHRHGRSISLPSLNTASIPTMALVNALQPLYSFQLFDAVKYVTVCFKTLAEKVEWWNAIEMAIKRARGDLDHEGNEHFLFKRQSSYHHDALTTSTKVKSSAKYVGAESDESGSGFSNTPILSSQVISHNSGIVPNFSLKGNISPKAMPNLKSSVDPEPPLVVKELKSDSVARSPVLKSKMVEPDFISPKQDARTEEIMDSLGVHMEKIPRSSTLSSLNRLQTSAQNLLGSIVRINSELGTLPDSPLFFGSPPYNASTKLLWQQLLADIKLINRLSGRLIEFSPEQAGFQNTLPKEQTAHVVNSVFLSR